VAGSEENNQIPSKDISEAGRGPGVGKERIRTRSESVLGFRRGHLS